MNQNNEKLNHAIRMMDQLDTTENYPSGDVKYINFHATEEDRDAKRITIVLQVESYVISVASSRHLPVYGWADHAAAIRRAEQFITLSGLKDRA